MKVSILRFLKRRKTRDYSYSTKSGRWAITRLIRGVLGKILKFGSRYFRSDATFQIQDPRIAKFTIRDALRPRNWLQWSVELILGWFQTRPYLDLVLGMPAVVAMAGLLFLASYVNSRPHQQSNYFSTILKRSYDEKDTVAVELCYRSMLRAMPERTDLQVARAIALTELDRKDEAIELMKQLHSQTSSTRAAFWLANNTLDINQLRQWTAEQHVEFRDYMKSALRTSEGWSMDEREIVMAKYLVGIQALQEAIGYLIKLVPNRPELALTTSILLASSGETQSAQHYAARATEYYRAALRENQADLAIRASLVQALVMQNREEEALQAINEGLLHSNSAEIRQLKSDILIMWSHRIKTENKSEASTAKRLDLIFDAVKCSPNRPIVMDAVFDIAMECRTSPNPDIRNLLAKTVQSVDPDVLHMIRGTIAAMDGDLDKAIYHLRMAEPSGKTLPVIYNNLASAISSKPGADLLEALRLVELAIRADANQAYFKETRGQILAKLDRHDEALRDLEAAMVHSELLPNILPTMISSCKKLGLDSMANTYQQKLHSISSKQIVEGGS
jgi:tetratricopeptide (TPR) repeat protein